MLNNDISNTGAVTIAIDLKELLITNDNLTLPQKISKLFHPNRNDYTINYKVERLIRKFYLNSNYNIEIVINNHTWDSMSNELKQNLMSKNHLNITIIDSYKIVYDYLNEGIYQYFVSDDLDTIFSISHRCCINLRHLSVLTNWRLP